MKRILMVAFHFPPAAGSSGHLRTQSFARCLPRYGWQPIVLTVTRNAHSALSRSSEVTIPTGILVNRAPALDSGRHLAVAGRYLLQTALPDRWASWFLTAVPYGLATILRHRPRVLWTTYPIATAHLIGLALHRLSGVPWVADFRDPMLEVDPYTGQHYPLEPSIWKARSWIENHTLKHCTRAVFVSPGAMKICEERYPELPAERLILLPNGYDEENFKAAERHAAERVAQRGPTVLLHAGVLYPTPDRNPKDFFEALARLRREGVISPKCLQIVLRASGHEDHYSMEVSRFHLQDMVRLEPPITYSDALEEMLSVDGLLLFQGYTSNPAIPAKLYEYLRARRPIFAMVHKDGDTAQFLREQGVGRIAPLDAPDEIAAEFRSFLAELGSRTAGVLPIDAVRQYSRETRAAELASVLDTIAP